MSDVAATPSPAVTPAKKAKKTTSTSSSSKTKKVSLHPKYSAMVKAAISSLKERGGSSRQAILKYIIANYNVGDEKQANNSLKMALRAGAKNGNLKQSKGVGASGSFKLGEKKEGKSKNKKKSATTKKATSPAKKPGKVQKPKSKVKKPTAAKKSVKKTKAQAPKKADSSKPKPKSSKPKSGTVKKAAAKKSDAKK